jgi:hypothetical protein
VVAALLLALGALFTTVGVASFTPSPAGSSAVGSSSTHRPAHARHDVLAPGAASTASKAGAHVAGPHLDLVAAVVALAAVILLLGWFVAGRGRSLLPRLVTTPLGARAPPALV